MIFRRTTIFALLWFLVAAVQPGYAALIAHYQFNGNASDSSGNGLDGAVNGASLAADRFGNANSAYSFDGTGDHVVVADSPLFAFGQNPYSFSFWFNLSNNTSYQPFLGQWGGTLAERATLVTYNYASNGSVRVHEEDGSAGNFTDIATAISTNEWHLMSLVREASGNSKLYLDAVHIGTVANRTTIHDASSALLIGADANTPVSFTGLMDDVRIYDSALDQTDIQLLFDETNPLPSPAAWMMFLFGLATISRFHSFKIR